MLHAAGAKPTQDRFGIGRPQPQGGCKLDQLVILLGNDRPVDGVIGENRFELGILIEVAIKRVIELLAGNGLEPGQEMESQQMAEGKGDQTLRMGVLIMYIVTQFVLFMYIVTQFSLIVFTVCEGGAAGVPEGLAAPADTGGIPCPPSGQTA